jgi:hypothetical protein
VGSMVEGKHAARCSDSGGKEPHTCSTNKEMEEEEMRMYRGGSETHVLILSLLLPPPPPFIIS